MEINKENSLMSLILGLSNDNNRKSCFIMLLQIARHLSGRNIDTGDSENCFTAMQYELTEHGDFEENKLFYGQIFAGTTMYLILLDLIGDLFINTEKKEIDCTNGIKCALSYFSNCEGNDKKAVTGLRHTLAHNFGLAQCASKNSNGRRKYTLSFNPDSPLVKQPDEQWNCDFSNKSETTSTEIGVKALGDLAENVVKNIYGCYQLGTLKFPISDEEEIKSRFTILI